VLFNSFAFVVFFALALVGYWLLRGRARLYFLLVASWVFYASWDHRFLALLVATTLIDYTASLAIAATDDPRQRLLLLVLSLGANLGILGFFKYYNFFAESLAVLLARVGLTPHLGTLQIILPVGISFYTFQSMSYTIDVYRRDTAPTRDFAAFAAYVAFFPHLVAGPIMRFDRLFPQVVAPKRPSVPWIRAGLCLVLLGYVKKVALADNLAPAVDLAFAPAAIPNAGRIVEGAILFACQIYGDFSGYSDIARGISYFLGIELVANFRAPYLARSVSEYWRRWHVSLSTWLRDYVYVPLGGSRLGPRRTSANLFLTMLVGGLWHGANWKYVVWGGIHGIVVACERRFAPVRSGHALALPTLRTLPVHVFWQGTTFSTIVLGFIVFRAASLPHAGALLQRVATLDGIGTLPTRRLVWALAAVLAMDLPVFLRDEQTWLVSSPLPLRVALYATLVVALMLLSAPQPQPFIYFAF
jgi:D-alanyl-lipoteichoic acid acyltransferase DltB (MBOAT superfamily)